MARLDNGLIPVALAVASAPAPAYLHHVPPNIAIHCPPREIGRCRLAQSSPLADAGLNCDVVKQVDPARHIAYLEAHIEQGPVLEKTGDNIGVVEGIVGMRRMRISFAGRADHAGTTPMAMRADAAAALFDFAQKAREALTRGAEPNTVWNIGIVQVGPGAANVVPAHAEFVLEYRDLSDANLDCLTAVVRTLVTDADGKNGVAVRAAPMEGLRPTPMDPRLISRFVQAARACGARPRRMSSGAGHDGMILASHIPAGMMFVPSIGGRSHDVEETPMKRTSDSERKCLPPRRSPLSRTELFEGD